MPDCPKWLLLEAKKEWERLCVKLSEMGVLTEIDMAAFAAYCQSFVRWKEAQEHIDSEGSTFETDKGYQQQTPWVGIANTNQKLMMQAASETAVKVPFPVKVSISDLNIRKGPGTDYDRVQFIPIGVYTILEVRNGKGSSAGWGSSISVTCTDFCRYTYPVRPRQ